MTDILDSESRNEISKYRLERAQKTLQEVDILLANGLYSTAISRMYYACFYAVMALMVKNGYELGTHKGVKAMLGLKFITTGLLDRKVGKWFNDLFDLRHRNDYDDFIDTTKEEVEECIPKAHYVVEAITDLLNT